MSENISWSVTAGGTSGSSIIAAGASKGDAIVSVSVDIDAGAPERTLKLQVDTVDNVAFFALASDLLDGSVTVQADTATVTAVTGPMLLFGAAVKLLAGDLSTVKVKNNHADKLAKVNILVGLKV